MDIFRLKVFLTAAQTLNFSRTAEQLYISQPAVSKHIGELELHFGVKLFVRRGSHLELTDAGRLLEAWGERIIALHRQMEHQMSALGNSEHGELRIGASTTIAQYVLPSIVAGFTRCFPQVRITMFSDNSERIEKQLFANETDLGLVENMSRRGGLHYTHFAADRLVVIAGNANKTGERISIAELQKQPLVLRERGSGTLEIVARRLASAGVSLAMLDVRAWLGSSEAIKSYVESSDVLSIISVAAVKKELASGLLRCIEVEGLTFEREFAFVEHQGEHNALIERFKTFALNNLRL